KLGAARTLVGPGTVDYSAKAGTGPSYGIRAKVCVVDWDGDGKLDLLVGDLSQYLPDKGRMTAAEKKAVSAAREKLPSLREACRQAGQEYGEGYRIGEEPRAREQRLARLHMAHQKNERAWQKILNAQKALKNFARLARARRPEAARQVEAAARKEVEAS